MILSCPSCQAQYVIPDGSIGEEGRTVKCTKCAHKWHQAATEDEVIHVDAEIFEPAEVQENQERFDEEDIPERYYDPSIEQAKESEQGNSFVKATAFSFLIFFALIFAVLLTGRNYFVQQWEPSAKLFNMVGLSVPVAGEGLKFDSVSADIDEVDGQRVLIVKGRIDNTSDKDVALPVLKISSYLANDWLKDWVIPLGGKIMQPQQSIAFDYRLSDIPQDNDKIAVTFAYE